MGALLDILLSLVIRGIIVVAVLNTTIALQSKLSEKTAQANMFNLTTTVSRIMSNDFTMVGYCPPGSSLSAPFFTVASKDTIEITYWDPAVSAQRWVMYFAGSTSELSSTSNPNDRKLYRRYRSVSVTSPSPVAVGVDSLQFKYFGANGDTTSTKSAIKSFSVYLILQTGEKVNGIYPAGEWTFRFFPSGIN